MTEFIRVCVVATMLLAMLAPASRADVIIVAANGTGDFTTLADAFDVALDGDIILVKPGNYNNGSNFAIVSGIGLTVIGDVGGVVNLPPMSVSSVPADSQFVLRNLSVTPNAIVGLLGSSLSLANNSGPVHVEDCVITGLAGGPGFMGMTATDGSTGLRVFNCEGFSMSRCTVTGGRGTFTTAQPAPIGQIVTSGGGDAITIDSSSVLLHRVTATAGDGGGDVFHGNAGSDGGRGLTSIFSQAVTSDSDITGGAVGVGTPPGAVGQGAQFSGVGSSLRNVGSSFTSGSGDPNLVVLNGPSITSPGQPWDVQLTSPLRTGDAGAIDIDGPPNTFMALFFSLDYAFIPAPAFQGAFLVGEPLLGPIILVTGPSGQLTLNFTAPNVPAGLEGFVTINQGITDQGVDGLVASGGGSYVQVLAGF